MGDGRLSRHPARVAQVVVLDRSTEIPVSRASANKSYLCSPLGNCGQAQEQLSSDLAKLGPDKLVIIKPITPFYASESGRAGAGAVANRGRRDHRGPGSIVAGSPRSESQEPRPARATGTPRRAPQDTPANCELGLGPCAGHLVRNNEGNYTFEAYDRVDFDIQAAGSTASQERDPGRRPGVQPELRRRDRRRRRVPGGRARRPNACRRLALVRNRPFRQDENGLRQQVQAMRDLIHNANTSERRQLVLIASLGSPAIQYYKHTSSTDDSLNTDLAQLVNEVGGSAVPATTSTRCSTRALSPTTPTRSSRSATAGPARASRRSGTDQRHRHRPAEWVAGRGHAGSHRSELRVRAPRLTAVGVQPPPTAHDPSRGYTSPRPHARGLPAADPLARPRARLTITSRASTEQPQARATAIEWIGLNASSLKTATRVASTGASPTSTTSSTTTS